MAKRPLIGEQLADAKQIIYELEERCGAPHGAFCSLESVNTWYATKEHLDPTDGQRAINTVNEIARDTLGDSDIADSLRSEGFGPTRVLVEIARTVATRYGELWQAVADKVRDTPGHSATVAYVDHLMVHPDLLPYVERLRARSPGLSDRQVALDLFNDERRSSALKALKVSVAIPISE